MHRPPEPRFLREVGCIDRTEFGPGESCVGVSHRSLQTRRWMLNACQDEMLGSAVLAADEALRQSRLALADSDRYAFATTVEELSATTLQVLDLSLTQRLASKQLVTLAATCP